MDHIYLLSIHRLGPVEIAEFFEVLAQVILLGSIVYALWLTVNPKGNTGYT
jgi:hypothetical protein